MMSPIDAALFLLHLRQNCPYASSRRFSAAQPRHQRRERQQIPDSDARAPRPEDHRRVGGGEVRPSPGNRTDDALVVDLQQEPHAVQVGPLTDTEEFPSAQRMERMGDPDKLRPRNGSACILA